MPQTVRGRFFLVSEPGFHDDFHDVLAKSALEALDKRERVIAGDVTLRLERFEVDGDFVAGEFCRKQIEGIPPSAGTEGLSKILLKDGDGLGHLSAFRYHLPTRALLLELNRNAVSVNRIALYVRALCIGSFFTFVPILRIDAWDRIANKQIKKLTIAFARPNDLKALEKIEDSAAASAAKLAEAYDGLQVELTVSVGRDRKRFLDKIKVLQSIRSLLASDVEPRVLDVVSADEDGSDPIDFIEESLTIRESLEMEDLSIDDAYKSRKTFLKREFDANLKHIEDVYKKGK